MNKDLRRRIVDLVYTGKDGHIPSAFSIVDIVAALYRHTLRVFPDAPEHEDRDYFILSKGHGCLALYVVLEELNLLSREQVNTFCTHEGMLGEHPDCTKIPFVEASTGSLGHGLPFAIGLALGLRIAKKANRVFVLVGDGECNEGTVWESALVASHMQLGNLCVIVDNNESATQILPMKPFAPKWESFGWRTFEVNGHSEDELLRSVEEVPFACTGTPTVIIANTVKGKGVGFIEGHGVWHHRIPNHEEYDALCSALA